VLALTLPSWLSQPAYDPGLELQERRDIAWLRDATAARTVLADNADVYRFYLSRARSVAALFVDYHGALVVRERGSYRPAVAGDFEGKIIIVRTHRPATGLGVLRACTLDHRPTVRVYDCAKGREGEAGSSEVQTSKEPAKSPPPAPQPLVPNPRRTDTLTRTHARDGSRETLLDRAGPGRAVGHDDKDSRSARRR
jgi:hypothetical protein